MIELFQAVLRLLSDEGECKACFAQLHCYSKIEMKSREMQVAMNKNCQILAMSYGFIK